MKCLAKELRDGEWVECPNDATHMTRRRPFCAKHATTFHVTVGGAITPLPTSEAAP